MKVLIADDHWVVRESLKQVLKRLQQSLDAYEAASFDEAVAILRERADIDLLLADLIMPGFEEFDGLKKLRAEFPEVPVVIVSVHEDIDHVLRAVEHGVIGYIPKSSQGPEIEKAFERVLAGEVYFPRRIIDRNIHAGAPARPPADAEAAGPAGLNALTNREREVLTLLGKGNSVNRIADALGLSSHTVRVHLGNLMKKLGLRDRAATIHYAVNVTNGARAGGHGGGTG